MYPDLQKELSTFERRTPKSAEAHKKNLKRIPLGVASNYRAYDPWPIFVKEAGDNVDGLQKELIKFCDSVGGNPKLLVFATADYLPFELGNKRIWKIKFRDVSGAGGLLRIPVARDLDCVVRIQNRIKDWLLRQTRRKAAHLQIINQPKFSETNWTPQFHFTPSRGRCCSTRRRAIR